MRVLFLINGLTHYVIPFLNKLNEEDDVDVIAISSGTKSANVGSAVYLTEKGINFKIYFLNETNRFYGKTFFEDFNTVLFREMPNIVVLGWPFILELVFNPFLLVYIKRNKIKILFKEIPFQVQPFREAMLFKATNFINENLELIDESFSRRILNFFTALVRLMYYKIVDGVITYTEDSYKLLSTFNVPKNKIFVSYNSPDTEFLKTIKKQVMQSEPIIEYNHQRIIHVGRLVKWKRVDFLIQAVSDLLEKFSMIELLVIGNGPEDAYLKLLSKKLNISNRVKFLGAIYEPLELAQYFSVSGIYVLGGMGGLSINEAMFFGKPIICSICDGTEKKLVRNGKNGMIFSNGDYGDFLSKLSILLDDKNKIDEYGNYSESIIENEINIKSVIAGYKKAFNFLHQ